jgi:hypothetical protein
MRVLKYLALLPLAAFGSTVTIGPLPPSEYADTEVSTNIPIRVNLERLDRMRFALELSPTATNDVEVLIGHDADTNGVLSVGESCIAFGYDCGQWFVREGEEVRAEMYICSEQMYVRRALAIRYKDFAPDWDLVKVVRRGLSASDESVSLVEERKRFVLFVR